MLGFTVMFLQVGFVTILSLNRIKGIKFELVEAKDAHNKPWQFVFDSRRLTVYFVSVVSSS